MARKKDTTESHLRKRRSIFQKSMYDLENSSISFKRRHVIETMHSEGYPDYTVDKYYVDWAYVSRENTFVRSLTEEAYSRFIQDIYSRLLDYQEKMSDLLLSKGDLLIVRTNGSTQLVGRTAVVPELNENMFFASYLIRLRCEENSLDPDYLQLMLKHLRWKGTLFNYAKTTAGQYNISIGRLKNVEIPIPKKQEQIDLVSSFRSIEEKLKILQELSEETKNNVENMMPSILQDIFSKLL